MSRNPVKAGLFGLVACLVLIGLALNAGRLPFLGEGGRSVQADFLDASGLQVGDPVEIAGIAVGRVTDLSIEPGRIRATFTVPSEVRLGEDTRATIKVSNLLGSKFLEVQPGGTGKAQEPIDVSLTSPAYDLTTAFGDLTETVEPINTARLEQALIGVADTFRGSGPDVRAALTGLSGVSRAIARRDDELGSLLRRSETLTGSLSDSRGDIAALLRQSGLLLQELDMRRTAIAGLVRHTRELGVQLTGLVQDNQSVIGPVLRRLGTVTDQLQQRQRDLRASLRGVATFARVFVNTIGGGPWFDSYIGNAPDSLEVEDPQ